ncbi:MAG TPA: hypothetical protein DIW30_03280 [Bacteroidales bacterium]|nr:hypothetical protein [Bacteroidales bacterium]
MRTRRDIAQQRIRLQKELRLYEKACTKDVDDIQEAWRSVGRFFSFTSSSLSYFLTGMSLARRFFQRKKPAH